MGEKEEAATLQQRKLEEESQKLEKDRKEKGEDKKYADQDAVAARVKNELAAKDALNIERGIKLTANAKSVNNQDEEELEIAKAVADAKAATKWRHLWVFQQKRKKVKRTKKKEMKR